MSTEDSQLWLVDSLCGKTLRDFQVKDGTDIFLLARDANPQMRPLPSEQELSFSGPYPAPKPSEQVYQAPTNRESFEKYQKLLQREKERCDKISQVINDLSQAIVNLEDTLMTSHNIRSNLLIQPLHKLNEKRQKLESKIEEREEIEQKIALNIKDQRVQQQKIQDALNERTSFNLETGNAFPEEKIRTVDNKLQNAQERLDKLQQEEQTLRDQVELINNGESGKIRRFEKEVRQKRQDFNNLNEKYSKLRKRQRDIPDELKTLQNKLDKLRQQLQESPENQQILNFRIKKVEFEIDNIQTELRSIPTEFTVLQDRRQIALREIQQAEDRLKEATDQSSSLAPHKSGINDLSDSVPYIPIEGDYFIDKYTKQVRLSTFRMERSNGFLITNRARKNYANEKLKECQKRMEQFKFIIKLLRTRLETGQGDELDNEVYLLV